MFFIPQAEHQEWAERDAAFKFIIKNWSLFTAARIPGNFDIVWTFNTTDPFNQI